jgi:hypothetical protein
VHFLSFILVFVKSFLRAIKVHECSFGLTQKNQNPDSHRD